MKRLGLPPRRLVSEDSETLQTSVPKTPIRGYVVGTTQNRALPPIMWTKASFTLASGNLSIMAQTGAFGETQRVFGVGRDAGSLALNGFGAAEHCTRMCSAGGSAVPRSWSSIRRRA